MEADNYTQFVDDTLLMGEAMILEARSIRSKLYKYYKVSG